MLFVPTLDFNRVQEVWIDISEGFILTGWRNVGPEVYAGGATW